MLQPRAFLFLGLMSLTACKGPDSPDRDRAPGAGDKLALAEIQAWLDDPGSHVPYVPERPLGITADLATLIPADNPITPAKVSLGHQLYFDPRLSRDGTVSCATCHHPDKGWTDNEATSPGIGGQRGGRSAPTVINRILGKTQFWDGRAATLEEQSLGPIENPIEMGFTHDECIGRLQTIPGYVVQFEAVFGGAPSAENVAKAIASFERTVLSGGSKNDYYEQAFPFFEWEPEEDEEQEFLAKVDRILDLEKEHRMSEAAERGRELFFNKAKCSTCHVGQDLTDEDFHNLGIGFEAEEPDLGRFEKTGLEEDKGKFKTPTVRNIASTAPYMHDGGLKTLLEVVEHYDKGGTPNPWLSDKIFPLELSDQEKDDLVTFMEEALSGPVTPVKTPRLP